MGKNHLVLLKSELGKGKNQKYTILVNVCILFHIKINHIIHDGL